MNTYIFFSLLYILILCSIILISIKFSFYDIPNFRKIHKKKTLNTSGLSLYIFLLIVISFYEYSYNLELIISYGFFIVLFGFLDDRTPLSPGVKIICLTLPSIFLLLNGLALNNLGEYEYIGLINLGKFTFIFTLLAVGLLINAYNYVDGIDGLLSSLAISTIVYIIFLVDDTNVNKLLLYLLIPLIINLIFNLLPQSNNFKIFLGDCGSLFLGFFIAFLLIYVANFHAIHPAYLMWSCWYPVFDFLYITIKRILNNKKFYEPDNEHLHHIILRKLKQKKIITLVLINLINTLTIIMGYQITINIGKIYSLVFFILLFFLYSLIRYKIKV